jgi:FSR family fosmidomycin resistance protein-like MFS transporter
VRADLGLSYAEIGLLLALPATIGSLVEPVLGIVADARDRRAIVLGGGIAFAAACAAVAACDGFWPLLLALALFNPASGAFVSISQAALADAEPERAERNLAKWALTGSIGNLLGPFALGAAVWTGAGWRGLYAAIAVGTLGAVASIWRVRLGREASERAGIAETARATARSLARREVWRWLLLLQFSDLMLDVLHGFLALYLVDVAGADAATAGVAIAVWTGVGLAGDAALVWLLERVDGVRYLRASAAVVLVVFPAFLLVPGVWSKVALAGVLGFCNAGWYAILKARLYSTLPGQSGAVLVGDNLAGLVGGLAPAALGFVAARFGLDAAMWLLLLGPIALLVGLGRAARRGSNER